VGLWKSRRAGELNDRRNELTKWKRRHKMVLHYWAVVVAAFGWFLVGRMTAQHAKKDITGKVPTSTRYLTRSGPGTKIEWKITKQEPVNFVYTIILIGLSIVPLLSVMIPQNWLKIIILSVLSLLIFVTWGALTPLDVRYYREVERQKRTGDETETTYDITYKLEAGPSPRKSDVLSVFAVALFWTVAYWGLEKIGVNDWVLTGMLLVAFALMVWLMYVAEKREQEHKQEFPFNYCERCGTRLKSETRPVVSREHRGGPYYIQRTDLAVLEKCRLCGYERQL